MQNGSHLFRSDLIPIRDASDESHVVNEKLLNTIPYHSDVMLDVVSFASILDSRERDGQPKLDPLDYSETTVSLLYRLVEVASLGQSDTMPGDLYTNVCHLAMLAFMATLLPEYGGEHSGYPLLSDRLESIIHDLHDTADSRSSASPLLLWTLFITGVSVLKLRDYQWLSLLISETCELLGLHDWAAVRRQLRGFPWINSLHDVPGRCLWEDAQRMSTEIELEFLQLEAFP